MIEKVNPSHPDKVADRIAGALVDLAYSKVEDPRIAVEVLLGHGVVNIIIESSVNISDAETEAIVSRITKRTDLKVSLVMVAQDPILASNKTRKFVVVIMVSLREFHSQRKRSNSAKLPMIFTTNIRLTVNMC